MKTEPLRGEKLLKTAINQILAHPETWDQSTWHSECGTKHCIAGWCQILSGKPADKTTAKSDARDALGISAYEANVLFRGGCSLGEMYNFALNFDRAGFNRDGFDCAGFNRDGFDCAGFDRDGFDRAGRDRDGFNRAGFDRDGFNRAGFDRAGRDRAGRDRAGFDRDGFDRDGFDRAGFDRAGRDRDGRDRAGRDRAGRDRAGKKLEPFQL